MLHKDGEKMTKKAGHFYNASKNECIYKEF